MRATLSWSYELTYTELGPPLSECDSDESAVFEL